VLLLIIIIVIIIKSISDLYVIDRAPGGGHYPFGGDVSEDQSFGRAGPSEPEHEYKPHPQRMYTSSITVNPPASFRPIPIQDQGPTPKPAPPAVPPKPFKDTSVFQNVDLHAVEVGMQSFILCSLDCSVAEY